MDTILTKYGVLKGVVSAEFYAYGNLKECILDEINEIETSTFLIKQQLLKIKSKCSSCSGCEACG